MRKADAPRRPTARAGARGFRCAATNSKVLRLSADETVSELFLKPKIAAFLKTHPMLSLEFLREDWLASKSLTGAELSLRCTPISAVPHGTICIGQQRLLTCASASYLRERGIPNDPHDLKQKHFDGIGTRSNSGDVRPWVFARGAESFEADIQNRVIVPSISMALALALDGAGMAQLPEVWALKHVRSGRFIRLFPEWEISLHLIVSAPEEDQNPDLIALKRFVRDIIELGTL